MSKPEVWKTWEGRTVDGKFPLRQWLGGSDHSAVFLTERPGQTPSKAAIKLVAAPAENADRHVLRWRAASALSHPHLMRLYESGRCQVDGTSLLYVVMECADEDLSQILPVRALLPAEASEMLPPLLDALSYLHSKGLVHSRIKPSNVLAAGDQLKLSSDQVISPAEATGAAGRRDVFEAPETSAGIVAPAGDMWSLGATLVTALTQTPPLEGDAALADPGVPASIPEPFRGIARECLHLDPRRRCLITDVQARLQPAARSVPEPERAQPRPPSARSTDPRYGAPILVLAVILVALVAGIKLFRHKSAADPATESAPAKVEQPPVPAATPATTPASKPAPAPAAAQPQPTSPPAASTRGEVAHEVIPDVPHSAKNTITGTIKVSVRVEVDASGKVTAAHLTTAGPSKYFAGLALNAARLWEFTPPQVNGQPSPSAWTLHFRYKRTSTQASADRAK